MIRINLLSEGRRPIVARRAKARFALGERDPSGPILLLGLLIGGLIAGGLWYREKVRLEKKDEQIEIAQAEVRELEEIIRKVEEFKAQQASLETKIAVIQDLKRKQRGPVQVMDQVSRSLPDLVWLDAMRLQGQTVTLRGQALNTNAVASFIGNLHQVPEFKEPDTKDIKAGTGRRPAYSFNIVFNFFHELPEEAAEDDLDDVAAAAP